MLGCGPRRMVGARARGGGSATATGPAAREGIPSTASLGPPSRRLFAVSMGAASDSGPVGRLAVAAGIGGMASGPDGRSLAWVESPPLGVDGGGADWRGTGTGLPERGAAGRSLSWPCPPFPPRSPGRVILGAFSTVRCGGVSGLRASSGPARFSPDFASADLGCGPRLCWLSAARGSAGRSAVLDGVRRERVASSSSSSWGAGSASARRLLRGASGGSRSTGEIDRDGGRPAAFLRSASDGEVLWGALPSRRPFVPAGPPSALSSALMTAARSSGDREP